MMEMCSNLDAHAIDRKFSATKKTGAAVHSFRNETLNRISQTIEMKTIEEPNDKKLLS